MKTLLLVVSLCTITSLFGSTPTGTAKEEGQKSIVDVNIIPPSVMEEFKASFIYENGYFRGAKIDMLRPYLNSAEIVDLVKNFNNYPPAVGVHVWEGYKPRPRGCRSNSNWICIISDVDVVHQ